MKDFNVLSMFIKKQTIKTRFVNKRNPEETVVHFWTCRNTQITLHFVCGSLNFFFFFYKKQKTVRTGTVSLKEDQFSCSNLWRSVTSLGIFLFFHPGVNLQRSCMCGSVSFCCLQVLCASSMSGFFLSLCFLVLRPPVKNRDGHLWGQEETSSTVWGCREDPYQQLQAESWTKKIHKKTTTFKWKCFNK